MNVKRVCLTVGLLLLCTTLPNNVSAVEIKQGKPAPDFSLNTLDGKSLKLSDYKGKKVILNFWATWCAPCKTEMPIMEAYHKEIKNQNIVVIAVNLTNEDQSVKAVNQYVNKLNLTFPIPLDKKGEVSDLYQILTIPTTFFIDEKGMLQQKVIGPLNEALIQQLIKET